MGCACCGGLPHPSPLSGVEWRLDRPLYHLTGRLVCADVAQMMVVMDHLPSHIAATRAEAGCLFFDVRQSDDPLIWTVEEAFADAAAFDAHQKRSGHWAKASAEITRDYTHGPAYPFLSHRAETERAGFVTPPLCSPAIWVAHFKVPLAFLAKDGSLLWSHPALGGRFTPPPPAPHPLPPEE